jgi:hypothetical protein
MIPTTYNDRAMAMRPSLDEALGVATRVPSGVCKRWIEAIECVSNTENNRKKTYKYVVLPVDDPKWCLCLQLAVGRPKMGGSHFLLMTQNGVRTFNWPLMSKKERSEMETRESVCGVRETI